MRPSALLVDHPALPMPIPSPHGIVVAAQGRPVSLRGLTREVKTRLLAQLLAATALLAELDLWPGAGSLANARVLETDGGLQAVLGGTPIPLSRVLGRLGPGEDVARRLVSEAVRRAAEAMALDPDELRAAGDGPGLFIEPWLTGLLEGMRLPLDRATARSLWAVQWSLPAEPEPGEVELWSAPEPRWAMRLAAAMWAAVRREGRACWLQPTLSDDAITAPFPALGEAGLLIVIGTIRAEDVSSAESWASRPGCSAVVAGRFPAGWSPPLAPGFESARIGRHLVITGLELDRARHEVTRRRGQFHPLRAADREALTRAASMLFDPGRLNDGGGAPAGRAGCGEAAAPRGSLEHLLSLLPEGLPEPLLEVRTGMTRKALRPRLEALGAVHDRGRWRAAAPAELRPDPLHLEVAALHERDDPRQLRHRALGAGEPDALLEWTRARLEASEPTQVRELLGPLEPGALGPELDQLRIEACLADLDLTEARRLLAGLASEAREPWRMWLEAIDPPRGWRPELPDTKAVERAPRVAATIAILALRRALRHSTGDGAGARSMLEELRPKMGAGPAARELELELAAAESPELLADRQWRRRIAQGHPRLAGRLVHRRAVSLAMLSLATPDAVTPLAPGGTRHALRLLKHLSGQVESPGIRGMIELDLGGIASWVEQGAEAESHLLRAYRLLLAAGFENRTRDVLFNLAASCLDRLEVLRAARRLEQAAYGPDDPFVFSESLRLALARGDEVELRRGLEQSRSGQSGTGSRSDARFALQYEMLEAVVCLLDGDPAAASHRLAALGDDAEAGAWSALAGALRGASSGLGRVGEGIDGGVCSTADDADGWGVRRAAQLIERLYIAGADRARASLPSAEGLTLRDAMALALIERLHGSSAWAGAAIRHRARDLLAESGLGGWSRVLQGPSSRDDPVLEVMATVVDQGPHGLETNQAEALLEAVGLTGIEVRSSSGERVVWHHGTGVPGTEVPRGRIRVIPLGGEPVRGPAWQLLVGVLEMLTSGSGHRRLPMRDELGDELDEMRAAGGFLGVSAGARMVQEELRLLAPSRIPVVMLGETGTGKDVAARALHQLSGRKGKLVAVNVAAIPGTLMESELFGSVKGAFTGADRSRQGLVDQADGGTLFFDEVGDLDIGLQVKLLRFLEAQEVRPVGGDRSHQVDVRIVSATHQDLDARVQDGRFRSDLYFRIAASPIHIPPLRERREDIPLLRALFEQEIAASDGLARPRWSREAESALQRHHWPGNVRELRTVVEGAMVRAAGGLVTSDLLQHLSGHATVPRGTWEEATRELHRSLLKGTLERTEGNRSAAARELGISRQTLLYHMRRLGVR